MGPTLSAYLDGEVGADGRGRVEKHLSACQKCREFLRLSGEIDAVLGNAPLPPQVNQAQWDGVLQRVLRSSREVAGPRNSLHRRPGLAVTLLAAAAAAALLLVLVSGLRVGRHTRDFLPAQEFSLQESAPGCQAILVAAASEGGLNLLVVSGGWDKSGWSGEEAAPMLPSGEIR
jgi:anti-sigma factor RsiW